MYVPEGGAVFKLCKAAIDAAFQTSPGWQRWIVNEAMVHTRDQNPTEIPITDAYIEEIITFDEMSYQEAKRLFPAFKVILIRDASEARAYLVRSGEITNEQLEQYYADPTRAAEYLPKSLSPENTLLQTIAVGTFASYEEYYAYFGKEQDRLEQEIFDVLGIQGRSDLDFYTKVRERISDGILDNAIRTKAESLLAKWRLLGEVVTGLNRSCFEELASIRAQAAQFKSRVPSPSFAAPGAVTSSQANLATPAPAAAAASAATDLSRCVTADTLLPITESSSITPHPSLLSEAYRRRQARRLCALAQ
jgi:hypothetical protein